jgi:hypothetical protein
MVRKPKAPESKPHESQQVQSWTIYLAAAKQRWLGYVDAETEEAAIAEGAKQFKKEPSKLIAMRRR